MRALLVAAAIACVCASARAAEMGLYKVDPKGRVRAVRAIDVDGDGRKDVVALVTPTEGVVRNAVVVWRTPASPVAGSFFDASKATVIACDGEAAGARAAAGAVAVGRFGKDGAVRLRFLGPDGATDVAPDGGPLAPDRPAAPKTLLVRGPGETLVFWDAVADLDGDGLDECWFPDAQGRIVVHGGKTASDATLDLAAVRRLARDEVSAFDRRWDVPSLVPADFDGDGRVDLASLSGTTLLVWRRTDAGFSGERVALPFLERPPTLPKEEVRAPRVAIEDVDRDRKADLLVTMVQGRADKIGGLRTVLYHYAGPLLTGSGALPAPRSRIDTESVSLHPRFRDVDGDGRLDYVGDSIRGNVLDLIQRIMGKEPEITFTAYRFDAAAGTFAPSPYATFVRPYSGGEARGNRFGQSGWFDGDFDRDGHADFVDLGNLSGVEILRGARGGSVASGGQASFDQPLLKRVRTPKPLATDALVVDLDADGDSDALLWSDPRAPRGDGPDGLLFVVAPK